MILLLMFALGLTPVRPIGPALPPHPRPICVGVTCPTHVRPIGPERHGKPVHW